MFIDRLPDYLRCPVCLCCLTNPYQTPCGHRFCKDCILPIIHSRNPVCPVDRTPVNTNNTFPDNAAKLQINGLKTRCLNKGCDWTGEYSDWIAHKCAYAPVACDYCHILVSTAELNAHKAVCPKRKVCLFTKFYSFCYYFRTCFCRCSVSIVSWKWLSVIFLIITLNALSIPFPVAMTAPPNAFLAKQ